MKTNIYALIIIFIISFTACNSDRILIEDFEFDNDILIVLMASGLLKVQLLDLNPQQPLPNQAPVAGFRELLC